MQDQRLFLIQLEDILEYRGYDVRYVSNFTDVDDKLIRVANEVGDRCSNDCRSFY